MIDIFILAIIISTVSRNGVNTKFPSIKIPVELLTHTLKVVDLVTLNVTNAFGEGSVDEPVLKPPLTI